MLYTNMSCSNFITFFICVCSGTFAVQGMDADGGQQRWTSAYYDPSTKLNWRITSIENMLVGGKEGGDQYGTKLLPSAGPGKKFKIRRIGFRSNGCSCHELQCGCCLGIRLEQFNFNREGCMNFTYYPQDFAIGMDVFMNENAVFSNSFSAKNPPPLCVPIPLPYIPIDIQACARLYDIYTPGANLHMCLDFETRVEGGTLLVLHFDCMRMGLDGIAPVKPGVENAGISTSTTAGPDGGQPPVEEDIFDEVTEVKMQPKDANKPNGSSE